MGNLGIIVAILFMFFFLFSIKSIVEKKSNFIVYAILSSVFFGVIFIISLLVLGK